ncbi:MAG TPA: T9SS type A sorting domain-containing protein [Bacteroidales bacterium]|nr:T9SS type A sorting domain-containing protein [Bacteroidales bacterium]
MKKLLLSFVGLMAFVALMAQPCTPDAGCKDVENPGEICPMAFDTGYVNVPYEQVITFIPPATYNYSGQDLTVQKIVINSVTGLPNEISWDTDADEFIPTNPITRYCGVMFGTPLTTGEYTFGFSATVYIQLSQQIVIPVPVTEADLNYTPLLVIQAENMAPPVAEFSASATSVPGGEVINFTDESFNATTWQWTFEGANEPGSTEQNPTATWNTQGTYDVTLTVTNTNCTPPKTDTYVAEDYITITSTVFINPNFAKICSIYPNPSQGIVNIEGTEIQSVSVYNSLGQVVHEIQPNASRVTLDISHLQKGAYIVSVITEKGIARTGITLE